MLKVGLVTGSLTPSALAAPRTKVVLPAPSSPRTSTRSPSSRFAARAAPAASVSCGPTVSMLLSCTGETVEPARSGGQGQKKPARGRMDAGRLALLEGWRQPPHRPLATGSLVFATLHARTPRTGRLQAVPARTKVQERLEKSELAV